MPWTSSTTRPPDLDLKTLDYGNEGAAIVRRIAHDDGPIFATGGFPPIRPPADQDGNRDPNDLMTAMGQNHADLHADGMTWIWRPTRPGYEEYGHPEHLLVHVRRDAGPITDQVDEAIRRSWPDLRNTLWARVALFPTWRNIPHFDGDEHLVVCDNNQFQYLSNWRGGVLITKTYTTSMTNDLVDISPITTRVPFHKDDFLTQLNLDLAHYTPELRVNGVELESHHEGVFFVHGMLIELFLRPTPSIREDNSSSFDLQDLLRTPSHPVHSESDQAYGEEHESESPVSSYTVNLLEGNPDAPSSDHEGTDRCQRQHERQCETIAVEDDDDDAGAGTRSTESGDPVISPEACHVSPTSVILNLAEHLGVGDVDDKPADPESTHVVVRKRIKLDLLVPIGPADCSPTIPVTVPTGGSLDRLLSSWPFDLPRDLPDHISLHEATKTWLHTDETESMPNQMVLHYYTDGSAHADHNAAAWAFAVCAGTSIDENLEELHFLGWLAGSVLTDDSLQHWIGAQQFDSIAGESSALIWAVLHAFSQHPQVTDVVFHFDAINVGYAMDARFRCGHRHPIIGNLRMFAQGLEALFQPEHVHSLHVKGHEGHPLNELVNTLASHASIDDSWLPSLSEIHIEAFFQHGHLDLKWLWLMVRSRTTPQSLPAIHAGTMHLPHRAHLHPTEASLDWTFGYGLSGRLDLSAFEPNMVLIGFNVRSLKETPQDAPDFVPGRMSYLESQIHELGAHVVGLQETRTRESEVSKTAKFHKFKSAADKGHGGIELWFACDKVVGYSNGTPVRLQPQRAVVVMAQPELLAVRIPCGTQRPFLFLVGHAPHKGHEDAIKEQWWRTLDMVLRGQDPDVLPILLLDANAALGDIETDGIGQLDPMPEDLNGACLRQLVSGHRLWLPSTFPEHHEGPTATWFSSAAKSPHGLRNDYIALPMDWRQLKVTSSTAPTVDVAQRSLDHVAIIMEIFQPPRPTSRSSQPTRPPPRVDWQAVRACRDRNIWDKVFSNLRTPPWEADVHSHWQTLRDDLVDSLATHFPRKRSTPKKPYISDEVWQLRNHRQALRRQAALHCHLCPRLDILVPFQTWRLSRDLRSSYVNGLCWLLRCLVAHRELGRQLHDLQPQLRQALCQQRDAYLNSIADQADQVPRNQIYAQLRLAGFKSRRRHSRRPLPMLQDGDGNYIQDDDKLKEAWRSHFAGIECGKLIDKQALLQLCILNEIERQAIPAEDVLQAMPTLLNFEGVMLNCRPHRAAGPDLLPPELCKFACRWLAYHLGPLVLKCSLYQSEPLAWKGGILHEIYKQKGSTSCADSYRGILVSSHLAKCLHNIFRTPTMDWHCQTADPLQLGGRPHMGVNMATHTLKTFLAVAKEDARSTCIFYLDIKSAYYRLLRSLSIGPTCSTPELMTVFATMGLPNDLMHELIVKANEISALAETGCPDWLRGYAVAYHQNTWFHVREDPKVTMTLRGTRPGDGFADLLFSLVIGRLLRTLEADLVAEGLQTSVSWDGERSYEALPGDTVTCSAFNIVWADDIAVLLQNPDANTLLEQAKYVMARYVERFAAHGLLLNFDKGKSECMLNLRGPGSRGLNRSLFQVERPHLVLDVDGYGAIPLRIVRQYKHLGNVLHASGHCMTEMRIRVGAANTAFNAHRKSIYQNTRLSLDRRVQIFQACVLSILYWNIETWTLVRPCEERYFTGAVLRLLRRFLHRDVPLDLLHHWPSHRVHAHLGLPETSDMFRLKRLSYYGSLVRFGPDALWALIASERHWISALKHDLRWLSQNSQSKVFRPPFDSPGGPDFWRTLPVQQPGVWKGLLKKAKLHATLQSQIRSEADTFCRHLASLMADYHPALAPADSLSAVQAKDKTAQPWVCIPCRRTFVSKAAWGVHCFKAHGRLAKARYVSDQPRCDICMHSFHNSYRLYLHLRYSSRCLNALRRRGHQVPPAPGRGSRQWLQEEQYTQCPYLLAEGPALPAEQHCPLDIALSPHEADLLEALIALELDCYEPYIIPEVYDQMWIAVRDVLCQHPVDFDEMQQTLEAWRALLAAPFRPGTRLIPVHIRCWLFVLATTGSPLLGFALILSWSPRRPLRFSTVRKP